MDNSLIYDEKIIPNNCWWLHVGKNIYGHILYCGHIEDESLKLMASLASKIDLYSNKSLKVELSNIKLINNSEISKNYDAVIINNYDSSNHIDQKFISLIITDHLKPKGHLCLFEANHSQLKNSFKSPLLFFKNLFTNIRSNKLKALLKSKHIHQYLTASSEIAPDEGYPIGTYYTNKNTFLLKEKFKCFILNSKFSHLFLGSVVWSGQKNQSGEQSDLVTELISSIKLNQNLNWNKDSIRILKIYYKVGKIIFSFTSQQSNTPEYILILALTKETYKQRINEKETLKYLKKIEHIKHLITQDYYVGELNNLTYFIMDEFSGVTIDEGNKNMPLMMNNSADLLYLLTKNTSLSPNSKKLEKLCLSYIELMTTKYPQYNNEISTLIDLLDIETLFSLPLVCMHGDYKLENVILDKSFNAKGFIDWELSEIAGLPLMDIFYLIVYNQQVTHNLSFDKAFNNLTTNNLFDYEITIIKKYLELIEISKEQYKTLLILFFIHHYSKRFTFGNENKFESKIYEASIKTAIDILKT